MKIGKFDLLIRIYVLLGIASLCGIGFLIFFSIIFPIFFMVTLALSYFISASAGALLILLLVAYNKLLKGGNYTNAQTKKYNRRLEN